MPKPKTQLMPFAPSKPTKSGSLVRDVRALIGQARNMVQFYDAFLDEKIVVSLIRQLSWTHFLRLIPMKSENLCLSS